MHSRFAPFFTGFLFVVYASASLAAPSGLEQDDIAMPDFSELAQQSNELGKPGGALLRDTRAEIALPGFEHVGNAPFIGKPAIAGKPDPRPQVLPAEPQGVAGGKPDVQRPQVLPAEPHGFAGGKPDVQHPQVLPAEPHGFAEGANGNKLLRPQVLKRAVAENNAGVAEIRREAPQAHPVLKAAVVNGAAGLSPAAQLQNNGRIDDMQKRQANWQRWAQQNPMKCVFNCESEGDKLARNLGVDKDIANIKSEADSAKNAVNKVSKLVK
jgi:hypothetical protein